VANFDQLSALINFSPQKM